MVAPLRDELVELKASVRRTEPDDLVFSTAARRTEDNPTREPRAHAQSNIRMRVLAPAIKRANEHRAKLGEVPLPEGLSPHKLRHTAISAWLPVGYEIPRVKKMAGHATAHVTLNIYAHVTDVLDDAARDE
jgi:integrase